MNEKNNQKVFDPYICADAKQKYSGCANETADFFTREQLMETVLWGRFVEQFRDRLDDSNNGWRGEYWGKMMRGAVMVWKYTRDPALYATLTDSVRDMLTVAEADGRVSSFTAEKEFISWDLWCRKYVMLGMEYYYDICEDEALKEEIVYFVSRLADHVILHIGEGEGQKRITKASRSWYGLNSSSILEPMVWLYRLTGKQKYLDFATYIVEVGGAEGYNVFEMAYENKLYPYQYGVAKAYEMMSCFEGLIEYYHVTGIEKYKTAAVNFGRAVIDSEISVIGSCGCTHELFDHTKNRQTAYYEGIMQETCVTVTWMKYCGRLLEMTGDPVFADCIEHSFYNAYLGALNTEHKDCPRVEHRYITKLKYPYLTYTFLPVDSYSPLTPGKRGREVGGLQLLADYSYYGCCTAIAAAGVGTFFSHMVMQDDRSIMVQFYEKGSSSLVFGGAPVELVTETAYPADGCVKLTVRAGAPVTFALKLRVPAWSKDTVIKSSRAYKLSDGYAVFEGAWNGEEAIELNFDMRIRTLSPVKWETDVIYTDMTHLIPGNYTGSAMEVAHADADDRFISLSRGPLTLAADSRSGKAADSCFTFEAVNGKITCNVSVSPEITSGVPCMLACDFRAADGSLFRLVDYASAGRDWDTVIAAWLPIEG